MAARTEILVSGRGGQGVVRLGQILGLAAVRQGLAATLLVSHGTETRGGYVRSQVVIADRFVDSPVVERADCFCALSQEAYGRFQALARGTLLHEADVVPGDDPARRRVVVRGAELAAQVESPRFASAVFLGATARVLEAVLDRERVLEALAERLPRSVAENRRAFELGWAAIS